MQPGYNHHFLLSWQTIKIIRSDLFSGTLTKNRMNVVKAFFQASIEDTDKKEKSEAMTKKLTNEVVELFCDSVSINSSYSSQVIVSYSESWGGGI